MALHENLEELLKHMSDADAKSTRDQWEKNPALAKVIAEGTMRQSEFNKQLNAKDDEVKTAKADAERVRAWEKENRPKFDQLRADYEKAERDRLELQEKLKSAATRASSETGETVTAAELEERVAKRLQGQAASKDDIAALISQESAKIINETKSTMEQARKDFLEKTFPAATRFQADLMEVMWDHEKEFGKRLDRKAFSDFMQKEQIIDPRRAWEMFTATERQEKKINDEVNRRFEEKKKELAALNLPGVSGTGRSPSDLGVLELKIQGETPKFPDGSRLGDRSASVMAAEELVAEGKF